MPPQTQKKKHSISVQAATLLIALAILFDGIQFGADFMHAIPVVGNAAAIIFTTLLDVWAYLSIWLGFKLAAPDISFMNPKRAIALNGGLLIELIPVINALPAWTLAVVIIVITSRGEEAVEKTLEKTGKMMGAAGKLAGAAAKLAPNPALRKGLAKVSKGASQVSEFAHAKAAQARSIGEQKKLGSGTAVKSRDFDKKQAEQDAPGARMQAMSNTPRKMPPPPPSQNASKQDIGAHPIFRQTPPPQSTTTPQPKIPRENPYEKGA